MNVPAVDSERHHSQRPHHNPPLAKAMGQPLAAAHTANVTATTTPLPTSATLIAALGVVEAAVVPFARDEQIRVAAEKQHQAAVAAEHDGGTAPPSVATPFHSSAMPELSLPAYARHVAKATGYGAEGLAVALALMSRYDRVAAVQTGSGLGGITPLTMHRLFAACMQLGMKTASDFFVKNGYVASMCGLTLGELNYLEVCLAKSLGYRLLPTARELCELPRVLAGIVAAVPSGSSEPRRHPALDAVRVRALLRAAGVTPLATVAEPSMRRFSACAAGASASSPSSMARHGFEDYSATTSHLPDSFGGSASLLTPHVGGVGAAEGSNSTHPPDAGVS